VKAPPEGEVTRLLEAWSEGDQNALEKLTPIVYNELRRLARHYLNGERTGISLETTALVNEAYLRPADYKRMRFENRAYFLKEKQAPDLNLWDSRTPECGPLTDKKPAVFPNGVLGRK
jgi:hypothetical protein